MDMILILPSALCCVDSLLHRQHDQRITAICLDARRASKLYLHSGSGGCLCAYLMMRGGGGGGGQASIQLMVMVLLLPSALRCVDHLQHHRHTADGHDGHPPHPPPLQRPGEDVGRPQQDTRGASGPTLGIERNRMKCSSRGNSHVRSRIT